MTVVRPARPDDYAGVETLRRRYEMRPRSREEWQHAHAGSPAAKACEGHNRFGWVVEAPDGAVGGFLGNLLLAYALDGRPLVAAAMTSWVVLPEHRSQSLLLLRAFFAQRGVDLFLNTTANENSGRVLDALRVPRVPVPTCDRCLYWVTGARGFAESALRTRGVPAARILAWPAAAAVRLRGGGSSPQDEAGVPVPIDGRFDAFERASATRTGLRLRRDRDQLAWALEFAVARGDAWVVAVEAAGDTVGYGIFLRRDRSAIGLSRVRLIDLQLRSADRAVVASVLSAGLRRCRESGVHVLEATGFSPDKHALLAGSGARQRTLSAWPCYYRARAPEVAVRLQDPSAWDPCELDGDGSV